MKSPKFAFSQSELSDCINPKKLNFLWKNKLRGQIRKQLIPDLLEFKDYDIHINSISREIYENILSAQYLPSRPRHYLVEKSRGLCRQMTLAQPRDLLVLQALSSTLHTDLKTSQPTNKAFFQPGDHKFNEKKLILSAEEYGSVASWKRFQQAIFAFSKERRFIIITDVANFYDFINFSHLRNIIASLCRVRETILDFLLFILNELSWNPDYMPRTEIALPQMEIEAPRVLANAMLYELDKVADTHSFGDYVRFMDDIDVGVDSIAAAKRVIRDIDLTLQSRQLRLNASKTKILNAESGEAADHFCIKENKFIDFCSERLESASDPTTKSNVVKALDKAYVLWKAPSGEIPFGKDSRFFRGNGEKIFKRIMKVRTYVGKPIPPSDLVWMIKNVPSLRGLCFRYLSSAPMPNRELFEISDFLYGGLFVDDAAIVELANFIVHAKFRNTKAFRAEVRKIVFYLEKRGDYFSLFSAFWVASKLLSPNEILALLSNHKKHWMADYWLGRTVGGLCPVIAFDSRVRRDYLQLIQETDNPQANSVYNFHSNLETDLNLVKKLFGYMKRWNPTFPQKMYHPKALLILSASRNDAASDIIKQIKRAHGCFRTDPYYKSWGI